MCFPPATHLFLEDTTLTVKNIEKRLSNSLMNFFYHNSRRHYLFFIKKDYKKSLKYTHKNTAVWHRKSNLRGFYYQKIDCYQAYFGPKHISKYPSPKKCSYTALWHRFSPKPLLSIKYLHRKEKQSFWCQFLCLTFIFETKKSVNVCTYISYQVDFIDFIMPTSDKNCNLHLLRSIYLLRRNIDDSTSTFKVHLKLALIINFKLDFPEEKLIDWKFRFSYQNLHHESVYS